MIALLLFLAGYVLNMFFISLLYHRGLAHNSVLLGPRMLKFIEKTGVWMTGLDPVSWVLMHRVHHLYSDQEKDPHSPMNGGIFSVWMSQYKSYLYFMERMKLRDEPAYNTLMKDIPLKVSHVNSNLPYLLHFLIALSITWYFENWWAGIGYFFGIMGHPVQGWMINALAHRYGKRSYETNDHSKNNLLLAYIIFGEGLQNNHHAFPHRANFAMKFPELDPGFALCKICAKVGLVKL